MNNLPSQTPHVLRELLGDDLVALGHESGLESQQAGGRPRTDDPSRFSDAELAAAVYGCHKGLEMAWNDVRVLLARITTLSTELGARGGRNKPRTASASPGPHPVPTRPSATFRRGPRFRIAVRCVETGEVYESFNAAGRAIGGVASAIRQAVIGQTCSGGFHWERVADHPKAQTDAVRGAVEGGLTPEPTEGAEETKG